jgi:hypothetical protein
VDERETLIELLIEAGVTFRPCAVADYLLAHGTTVQDLSRKRSVSLIDGHTEE